MIDDDFNKKFIKAKLNELSSNFQSKSHLVILELLNIDYDSSKGILYSFNSK